MAIMNNGAVLVQGNPADFINELKSKIWQKEISKYELANYKNEHQIISSQFIAGKMNIHILADHAPANFDAISPTLEDVYFTTLNKAN
jgi:hypothetical protein